MNKHARQIAKNASIVGGATLLSRVLGFLRDMIMAYALGAGGTADAFFVAFQLPNLLRRLFAEGSMTMAFVPVFSELRERQGDKAAFSMPRAALVWLLLILSVVTLAAMFFAKDITLLVAPGFAAEPGRVELTARLVRIVFPYIIFISAVALCMGVLNTMGHFLAPALATSVLNIALITGALIGFWTGNDVALCLAWAVLAGGFGQWLLQQPFLRGYGFRWRGAWKLRDENVKRMGLLMLPTAFGAATYQLNVILGRVLASLLPTGAISYLYYADRLVQFPLGVFGVAVGTVALPSLAKLANNNQNDDFIATLNASLRLTLFICLPAAAGLIGLAEPMVSALFGRGAFTPEAARATAGALIAYGVGLPAFACVRPLYSAYFALHDTKTPAWTAAACLVVYVASGFAMMQSLAHVGLALATSLSSWVNVLVLWWFLRKRVGPWLDITKTTLLCSILSVGVGCGSHLTAHWPVLSLALIPVWAAAYLPAAALLRIEEAAMLTDFVRNKLGPRLKRPGRRSGRTSGPK